MTSINASKPCAKSVKTSKNLPISNFCENSSTNLYENAGNKPSGTFVKVKYDINRKFYLLTKTN